MQRLFSRLFSSSTSSKTDGGTHSNDAGDTQQSKSTLGALKRTATMSQNSVVRSGRPSHVVPATPRSKSKRISLSAPTFSRRKSWLTSPDPPTSVKMQVSHSSPEGLPRRSKDRLVEANKGESDVVPEAVPEEDEVDHTVTNQDVELARTGDLPFKLPSLDMGSEDSHHDHDGDDESDAADTTLPTTDLQDDQPKGEQQEQQQQPAVARIFSKRAVEELDLRGPAATEADRADTLRKKEELSAFLRQYVYSTSLLIHCDDGGMLDVDWLTR